MAMDRRDTLGQVTLDPATHECQIDYRIGINLEDKMAVPKGKRQLPVLEIIMYMSGNNNNS